eukprot:1244535-Amphidinium_carterae.1
MSKPNQFSGTLYTIPTFYYKNIMVLHWFRVLSNGDAIGGYGCIAFGTTSLTLMAQSSPGRKRQYPKKLRFFSTTLPEEGDLTDTS